MLKKLFLLPIAGSLLLAGCSTTKVDPYLNDPPEYIYAKGHQYLQKNDYTDALKAYQSLDSQYPFNPLTQKGDLESVYAYYENDDPAMAMTAASRYIKVYPNAANLDYAYYMTGVINFENGRGFLQRYLPYNMSQHNAPNYTYAFNDFATVINNYPDSPYAPDARRRMIYLNNTLAQYQLNVANMNFAYKAYVAAANRAQNVLINYPTSPMRQQALQLMIKSYQALGLNDLADSINQVLALNNSGTQSSNIDASSPSFVPTGTIKIAPIPASPNNMNLPNSNF